MTSQVCHFLFIALLLNSFISRSQSQEFPGLIYYKQSLDKSIPFQQAVNAGEMALAYFEKKKNDSLENLAHIQLGILYWHDGQFEKAWDHLSKGESISVQRKEAIKRAQCFHYKGLVHYYKCNFDSALQWYERAEREFELLKIDSARAKLKSHKALIYSATGQYKLAIQNLFESFKLQESSPWYRDMTIPMDFFTPSQELFYYKSKLEKDLESLQFIELTKDKPTIAFTWYNVGLDYMHLNNYVEALRFFKKASNLYSSLKYPSFSGSVADAFVGLRNYDSANLYFNSWMNEIRQRGTQIHLTSAYTKVAACCIAQKKWKDALYYVKLAKDLNRKIGLRRAEAVAGKTVAQLLLELGDPSTALKEINSSLGIVQQIGCIKDIQVFLKLKSEILLRLKQYEGAAESLHQSVVLHDSIQSGEGQLQVARLQAEYETEKKSQDLAELQALNKLKEAEITSRNLQIALAFSMLIIVTAVGGFFFYRYRQKKRSTELLSRQNDWIETQNQKLQAQNNEKQVLLSELHHRVKNNLQIISSLINLKSTLVSAETFHVLQQLNGRIFSMGLIHEKLYQKEDIKVIRLDLYLAEIGNHLLESFTNAETPVQLDVQGDPVEMDADKALSCGLICNELMVNSLKYAFADSQRNRSITLRIKKNDGFVELQISDNGGKQDIPIEIKKSFGLRFADQLINSKLKGTWSQWQDNGFHVDIHLPIYSNGKN